MHEFSELSFKGRAVERRRVIRKARRCGHAIVAASALAIDASVGLFVSQAKATAITASAPVLVTGTTSTISSSYTSTAGGDVLVVELTDKQTSNATSFAAGTLTWDGITLTDVADDVSATGTTPYRQTAIFYAPISTTMATSNIVYSIPDGSDVAQTYLTAFTLTGASTTVAPVATGQDLGSTSPSSINYGGVPAGSLAAVNLATGATGAAVTFSGTGGGTPSVVSNTALATTSAFLGNIPNLSAGPVTVSAASANFSSRTPFVSAVFAPIGATFSKPNATISVNFLGGTNTNQVISPASTAGVVPSTQFNNVALVNNAPSLGLIDSNGNATTTVVQGVQGAAFTGNASPTTADQALNAGGWYTNPSITIKNIAVSGPYNLYVYTLPNVSGITYGMSDGTTTYYGTDPTGIATTFTSNPFNYVQATSTNLSAPTLGSDYIEFTGETASNITITTVYQSGSNAAIDGFQIVPLTTTAPTLTYTGAQTAGQWDLTSNNFSAAGTATTFTNTSSVLFDDTAVDTAHNITVQAGGVVSGGLTINTATGYNFSGGTISGTGGLTLNGYTSGSSVVGGTVTLNNTNTFTGSTVINKGTLVIGSTGSLATSTIFIASGATFTVNSGGSLTGAAVAVIDLGTVKYGNTSLTLGSLSGNGQFTFTTPGSSATLQGGPFAGTMIGNGLHLTLAGVGGTFGAALSDGSSPTSVIVNSTGIWALNRASTYTGGTTASSGVLQIASASALGAGPLSLSGGSLSAASQIDTINGTPSTIVANTVTGGTFTLATGGGALELSNTANSFTGPIVIQGTSGTSLGGTFVTDGPGTIGNTTAITVASGASFEVKSSATNTGAGTTITIIGNGVTSNSGGGSVNGPTGALRGADGQSDLWAGNTNVSGSTYICSGADAGGTASLTLTGAISGTGPVIFTGSTLDQNGGLVVLAPAAGKTNTYTGQTEILAEANVNAPSGFTLQLGANNGISVSSGLNVVGPSTPASNVFDLNGYNQSVKYLTGNTQFGNTITDSSNTRSTLTITSGLNGTTITTIGAAIQGNLSLVMNDPLGTGTQIINGSNSFTGTTTITKGTLNAASATALSNTEVDLNGGTLALGNTSATQAISNAVVAIASTTSTIQIGTTTTAGAVTGDVGSLNISSGAIVKLTTTATAGRSLLQLPSLMIAHTGSVYMGQLNEVSNALDLPSSVGLSTITAMLASGYNGGGWNGQGIVSSTAAAVTNHLTALGVIVNNGLYGAGGSVTGTFAGSVPASGDILVKYTYYGDCNLDGHVDGSDYNLIDAGFNGHGTLSGWQNGDFNYDNKIDGSDYTLIDNAFNVETTSLAAQIANPSAVVTAQIAGLTGGSAVPEPSTLGLCGLGTAGLLRRRRRAFSR